MSCFSKQDITESQPYSFTSHKENTGHTYVSGERSVLEAVLRCSQL